MANSMVIAARDKVRTFNKHVLNPVMMLAAGRKHWYASVISHTGRHSGKKYATPVVADRVQGGFIVPLPYGTGVDWLRNVLASGQAKITTGGLAFEVGDPEVIEAANAAPELSPQRRRAFERFGISKFVRLRFVEMTRDKASAGTPK